jgi:hypothetical protein
MSKVPILDDPNPPPGVFDHTAGFQLWLGEDGRHYVTFSGAVPPGLDIHNPVAVLDAVIEWLTMLRRQQLQ